MAFSFVNYEGPALPQDPSVRKLIRRQAMKDAAIVRKMHGGYGQHNLLQLPIFQENGTHDENVPSQDEKLPEGRVSRPIRPDSSTKDSPHQTEVESRKRRLVRHHAPGSHASTPLVSVAYPDCATAERFALLQKLAPLTGLRLGIAKFPHLRSELVHSRDLFSICNREAAGWRILLPIDMDKHQHCDLLQTVLLQSYDRCYDMKTACPCAALDDEEQRMTVETLCATELLGLFELLDGNLESHSWMRHVGGAAQLIQVRGAHRFSTDFELALFMAHIGPAVMEAFLNNKSCFLAEKNWKQVMCSVISNDNAFSEQKGLVLALWTHLVTGPDKFKHITDAVLSPTPPPQHVLDNLKTQLLEDRKSLVGWITMAQTLLGFREVELDEDEYGVKFPRLKFEKGTSDPDYISRLTLWGTYIVCRILKARLLIAMDPLRFRALEAECQHLANRIMNLREVAVDNESKGLLETLFMSQSTWIANGILETEDSWREHVQEGVIEKWKFEAWCRAMGRQFPQYEPDN